MNQPLFVSCRQPFADLSAAAKNLRQSQRADSIEFLLLRLSDDTFHHQIRRDRFAVGVFMHVVDGMDRDDVRMTDRSGGLSFTQKPSSKARNNASTRRRRSAS